MKLDFRIGDFVFRGRLPLFGRDGAYITKEEGWRNGVDMVRTTRPRPQADGDFPETGYAAGRAVAWSGRWYAQSDEDLADVGDRFASFLTEGGYERLFADEPNGTQWGDAGLVTSTFKALPGNIPMADYSIELKLPDPRKYGETHLLPLSGPAQAGVSVAGYHHGRTTAWPQFEIKGSAPGYQVNGPGGRAYIVTRALLPGETHLIDMKNGHLYVNGSQVLGGRLRADRWGIRTGDSVAAVLVVSSGSATMRQIVKDTSK
jgi:hypothetical protein